MQGLRRAKNRSLLSVNEDFEPERNAAGAREMKSNNNMSKTWKIVGTTVFWCLVVAYFVCASLLRARNEQERTVDSVEVVVKDADQRSFITPEKVLSLLAEEGINPVGKGIDEVDLAEICRTIDSYCFTAHSLAYINYSGALSIEVSQRVPLLRVMSDDGHDFYLTKEGYILPVAPHATLNLPIVTGTIKLPFGKSFEGNIEEWLAGGEKKYRENYNFLSKLINFVVYLETSEWEGCRCVQINLVNPKVAGGKDGSFVEPHIELVPRTGDYLVAFGKIDEVEAKMYRWRRFVEAKVVDMTGGTLCVEYEGQALWKAPKAKKKK